MNYHIMKLKEAFGAQLFLNSEVKRCGVKNASPCTVLEFHDRDITVILEMTSIPPAASSWQRAQHPRCGAGMANIWISSHTPPQTQITKKHEPPQTRRAAH